MGDRLLAFTKSILIFAAFFDGLSVPIGTLHFTAERLLLILFALPTLFLIVITFLFSRSRRGMAASSMGTWLFYAWGGWLCLSAFATGEFVGHASGLAISLAPLIPMAIFSQSAGNRSVLLRALPIIVLSFSIAIISVAVVGIVHPFGALQDLVFDRGRVKLFCFEPNILGSTIGGLLILSLPGIKFNFFGIIYIGLGILALLLSFSKGPYIAFCFGLAIYLWLTGFFKGRPRLTLLVSTAAVLTVVVASVFFVEFYSAFLDRPDAERTRFLGMQIAYARFLEHPIMGNGPLDFSFHGARFVQAVGSDQKTDAWIGQMMLAIAHDSGVVGLALYVLGIVFLYRHSIRLAWKNSDPTHASYVGFFTVLLISSQFTTVHLTPLFGAALGLLAAGAPAIAMRKRGVALSSARDVRESLYRNWNGRRATAGLIPNAPGRPHLGRSNLPATTNRADDQLS